MPAKAQAEETANADIKVLIQLMANATEFKADTTKMAEVCGLSAAKNVPRKINSILTPFGYELRAGKIIAKDADDNEKVDKDSSQTGKAPATPKTPKAPKIPKTPKTPGSKTSAKKRKLVHEKAESDNESIDSTEAQIEKAKDEVVKDKAKDEEVKEEAIEDEPIDEEA